MGTGDDPEDYVYLGTPLEREDELGFRKRKLALEKGQARRVAPWQQEVTDSEGRRRFHGAFTGGFSAGYYNTVGSKEGWKPASFSSSRKKRADFKEHTAYDFMDEDEKIELDDKAIGASSEFDTFGFTAAEVSRRQAALEVGQRPTIIPGPVPDEIVVPLVQSIGISLLLKMGWRHGRSIGPKHIAAAQGTLREARKAMMALAKSDQAHAAQKVNEVDSLPSQIPGSGSDTEVADAQDGDSFIPNSTPVFVLHPKNNKHGLGFDPFRHAPEFRDAKRARNGQERERPSRGWGAATLSSGKPSLFRPNAGKMSGGFGIGALEDLGEEDEDVYATSYDFEIGPLEHDIDPLQKKPDIKKKVLQKCGGGVLPGFKLATASTYQVQWFPPPQVPPNFVFTHKFAVPLHQEGVSRVPEPAAVPAPDDKDQCKLIDGLAKFVARCGQKFEDLCRDRNMGSSQFSFLFGGPGHDYYARKLWEEQQKLAKSGKDRSQDCTEVSKSQRLDAEQRGKILNETALPSKPVSVTSMIAPEDRARLQAVLTSTFTKSGSEGGDIKPAVQPFFYDRAKQARYEQYLKDKTRGGLRVMDEATRGLTEVQRAQEIFEFENAARGSTLPSDPTKKSEMPAGTSIEFLMGDRFTTSKADAVEAPVVFVPGSNSRSFPRREEHTWRPNSILCKRFDIPDPYAGKAPPTAKPRSRTDSMILVSARPEMETKSQKAVSSVSASSSVETAALRSAQSLPAPAGSFPVIQVEESAEDTITEKPVDLFKAIFSDSEDEENNQSPSVPSGRGTEEEQRRAAEAAHSALNRLVAGDFLESLGKELGLKVPAPVERRAVAEESSSAANGRSAGAPGRWQPSPQPDSRSIPEGGTAPAPSAGQTEKHKKSSKYSRSKNGSRSSRRKKEKGSKEGSKEQDEKKRHGRRRRSTPTSSSSTSTTS